MQTVIKKWGNSLGLRIPSFLAKNLSLKEGTCVEIEDGGNKIIIRSKEQKLQTMLEKINNKNLHNEVQVDASIGKEVW